MKKIFYLIATITLISTSSFAQVEKGGQLFGVQSVFVKSYPQNEGAYKTSSYDADLSLFHLFMVSNRIGLGYFTNLNFSGYKSENKDSWGMDMNYKNRSLTGHIGPMARYMIPITQNTYIFPQFLTGFGRNWTTYHSNVHGSISNSKSNSSTSLTEFQFGMANFLNQCVALETKIGYGWARINQNEEKTKLNALGASFAAVLYFNRKTKV